MTRRRLDTAGAIIFATVAIFGVYVAGTMAGEARQNCVLIGQNAEEFKAQPGYWQSSIRTLVEACERGE